MHVINLRICNFRECIMHTYIVKKHSDYKEISVRKYDISLVVECLQDNSAYTYSVTVLIHISDNALVRT